MLYICVYKCVNILRSTVFGQGYLFVCVFILHYDISIFDNATDDVRGCILEMILIENSAFDLAYVNIDE